MEAVKSLNVTYRFELVPGGPFDPSEVERIIEETTEGLIELGYHDAVIGGSMAALRFEIDVAVQAALDENGWVDVVGLFGEVDSAVRSAIHAAGVSTPGWPPLPDALRLERREVFVAEGEVDDETLDDGALQPA